MQCGQAVSASPVKVAAQCTSTGGEFDGIIPIACAGDAIELSETRRARIWSAGGRCRNRIRIEAVANMMTG